MQTRNESNTSPSQIFFGPSTVIAVPRGYSHAEAAQLADDKLVVSISSLGHPTEFKQTLEFYELADLKNYHTAHPTYDTRGITICPNGEITANCDEVVTRETESGSHIVALLKRALLDPNTAIRKKIVGEGSSLPWSGRSDPRRLQSTCLLNENEYIITTTRSPMDQIPVFDAKTHEFKTHLNLDVPFQKHATWREGSRSDLASATHLPNGKTIAVFEFGDSRDVVMFKFAEEKLSDFQVLATNDELQFGMNRHYEVIILPVSKDRFVSFSNDTSWRRKHSVLQLWNSNTGARIDEPVTLTSGNHINPQVLPNGSILCHCDNKIAIIDGETFKVRYYAIPCHEIHNMTVLADDRLVVISLKDENDTSKRDMRIIHLPEIFKYKQEYITHEIMQSCHLNQNVTNLTAEYVGCDVHFPKTQRYGGLFQSATSLTASVEFRRMTHVILNSANELIKFLVDKEASQDEICFELAVKLRNELKKPSPDRGVVEMLLRDICSNLTNFRGKAEYGKYVLRAERYLGQIEKIEAACNTPSPQT